MSWPRALGAVLQGLILGTLLLVALCRLLTLLGGAGIFDYQGF